jgi:hypothetical protein
MGIHLDHLVIAAGDLAEGVAWLEARLGVPMSGGGRHETMGTHNRLLSLGPGRYVEVIAIDPQAPPPGRPRWFDLDALAMRERLARGPALLTWAVRADDIDATIGALAGGKPEVLEMSRGAYRWRIGVPRSGALAHAGTSPTAIQWLTPHPTSALPDTGCRLEKLLLSHPDATATLGALRGAGLDPEEPIEASRTGAEGLAVRIRTPRGIVEIRG